MARKWRTIPYLGTLAERPTAGLIALPHTPALLAVAERVVWFKSPAEALADPVHFLAHVMTYGTVDHLRALDGVAGPDEFRVALEEAPAGVFDPRSWPTGI